MCSWGLAGSSHRFYLLALEGRQTTLSTMGLSACIATVGHQPPVNPHLADSVQEAARRRVVDQTCRLTWSVVVVKNSPLSGFVMLGCLLATLSRHNHTSRRLSRTNPCPDSRDLCPDVPTMFPIVMSSSRHHCSCSDTPICFSIYIHVVDRSNPRFRLPFGVPASLLSLSSLSSSFLS